MSVELIVTGRVRTAVLQPHQLKLDTLSGGGIVSFPTRFLRISNVFLSTDHLLRNYRAVLSSFAHALPSSARC